MPVKVAARTTGEFIYSEGDVDEVYGIASLSKIWASILIYDRIKILAAQQDILIGEILDEKISVTVDYEAMIYHRMDARPDLAPPDDPLTYRPFRKEKARFRLPVEKGCTYIIRDLFEAALFQSKNDAIQALADHFFTNDENVSFRAASAALAEKLGLRKTKIGDAHGLCDGDNVSTGRELAKFCGFVVENGYLEFFGLFDPMGKTYTADALLKDARLKQENMRVVLAKTATGNNRQGNDAAESLVAIAKKGDEYRIAVVLSDEDRFESVMGLLMMGYPA